MDDKLNSATRSICFPILKSVFLSLSNYYVTCIAFMCYCSWHDMIIIPYSRDSTAGTTSAVLSMWILLAGFLIPSSTIVHFRSGGVFVLSETALSINSRVCGFVLISCIVAYA